jgi:antitoxin ParD1/3/4/toxin ParE1/3/4
MSDFRFSPEAREDLWEIWHYVAIENDNVPAADRLWADIEKACAALARLPTLGHTRKDLTSDADVLFYCVREYYLILYRKGRRRWRLPACCMVLATWKAN